MGLYPLDCSVCKKSFLWFSGCLDTRCPDCQNGGVKKMKKSEMENKIKELEDKIKILEARPVTVFCPGHTCHCNNLTQPNPIYPSTPVYPGPFWGPITVCGPNNSCEMGSTTSSPLPPGAELK